MKNVRLFVALILLAALTVVAMPVSAQDGEGTLASGLTHPRALAYDADGNLWIAEAGQGGLAENETMVMRMDPENPTTVTYGLTGQVTMVSPDGSQAVAVAGLPSLMIGDEALGVVKAQAVGDALWVLLNEGPPETIAPLNAALLELDRETLRVRTYIDLFAYEIANNPDGTTEIYSNPSDFLFADDGTLYIVDTGANALYTWDSDSGLSLFNSWDNTVPTSIDFGPEGDIYIGFLGARVAPGAGHIEHWTRDGELVETFEGLTGVTDILVDDSGAVHAVQLFQFGEQGPMPESGSVVTVTSEGMEPVAEGLNLPYGIAQSPDGQIVVSTGTVFVPPGAGAVVAIN